MNGVPEPEHVNGNAWCYGKGQSVLVNKVEKNPKLGKSKNRIARKVKAAKNIVKNLSKTAGIKKR